MLYININKIIECAWEAHIENSYNNHCCSIDQSIDFYNIDADLSIIMVALWLRVNGKSLQVAI